MIKLKDIGSFKSIPKILDLLNVKINQVTKKN